MGLPSGTLWLDRPLGAKSVGDPGIMYQWGALRGYESPLEFQFSQDSYIEQGLDLIASNLTQGQDAASAYYGNIARMPTYQEINELLQNIVVEKVDSVLHLRSTINGEIIRIIPQGEAVGSDVQGNQDLFLWSSSYSNSQRAYAMHIDSELNGISQLKARYHGLLILPVHS